MKVSWDPKSLTDTATPTLPAADFLRSVELWRRNGARDGGRDDVIDAVRQAEQLAKGPLRSDPERKQ